MKKNEVKQEMVNQVNRLPEVAVIDNTTTKGKVNTKFNLVQESEQMEQLEKLDKNKVFAEVNEYFCPVAFDDTLLNESLSPLVSAGVMSEDVKVATIEKAKREFLNLHADELDAANKLTFLEVLADLQDNETLYKKVLTVCKVSELKESCYIDNNEVLIYRASQAKDKEGNNKYSDVTLTSEKNGVKFTSSLYVERRPITTDNIILAIRYYASKQEAERKLFNQLHEYDKILTNVENAIINAKENNFAKSDIMAIIDKLF